MTTWCVRYGDNDPHFPGLVAHVRMDIDKAAEFLRSVPPPRAVTLVDCGHEQDPPPQGETLWEEP